MNGVRRRLLFAGALAAWPRARAAEAPAGLPPAPAGFTWIVARNGVGTFLCPQGWFVKEESRGDTDALFITKQDIAATGRFTVGMTIDRIARVSRKAGSASAWASGMAASLAKRREVLRSGVVKGAAGDMNVLRVRDAAAGVILHYITVAKDAEDAAWLLIFEAPEAEWDADERVSRPMLNAFGLGR